MVEKKEEEKDTPQSDVPTKKTIKVTSSKTIDFPSLGWGIHKGEISELPVEVESQKIILSNTFINKIKE